MQTCDVPTCNVLMSRSIQARVLTLAGAGVLVSAGALSLLGRSSLLSLERSVERREERLAATLAEAVAHAVDDELRLLTTLTDVADADEERAALASILRFGRLSSTAVLTGAAGEILGCEPADRCTPASAAAFRRVAVRAIEMDRPVVSNLQPLATGAHVVAVMPFRAADGRRAHAAGVSIVGHDRRFEELLRAGSDAGTTPTVALLDREGQPIAITPAARPEAPAGGVTVPVRGTPWSLRLSDTADGAGASIAVFRRRSLWLAPALAALAMVLGWGIGRSIRQPLRDLTSVAERIARGELLVPIETDRAASAGEEIGRLAIALERMRASLASSMATIEAINQELERRVATRTEQLAAANAALEEREHARRELLRKLISAQEDERKRIARELHDETSQTLAALGMGLDTALAEAASPEAARRRLVEVRQLLTRINGGLHRLIVGLRPSVLDDLGLEAAIRSTAERHLAASGVGVRCEFENLELRFPPEVETAVFRAVQEAIVNIARHAGAESVLIQGTVDGAALTIEIEDDGVGFEPAAVVTAPGSLRGVGLLGMRERIEIIGGTVIVESEPGRGTRVVMHVPIAGHGEERTWQHIAS